MQASPILKTAAEANVLPGGRRSIVIRAPLFFSGSDCTCNTLRLRLEPKDDVTALVPGMTVWLDR